MLGEHNVENALAAMAAARHAGVPISTAVEALGRFRGIKRRLELKGEAGGVRVYDDFAHHPTAIKATLDALRTRIGEARLVAVLEPRSHTMRMGVHRDTLADALKGADRVMVYAPKDLGWDVVSALRGLRHASVTHGMDDLVEIVGREARRGDHVLVMSNGGFGGIHRRLLDRLEQGDEPRQP